MPAPRRGVVARVEATLRVQVLGGFAVTVGDRLVPASAWTSRKAQQLIKLLALAPGHQLTRDQIFDSLWPDQDPDVLAATFRQTCYLARRTLGHPESLAVRDGLVLLAPPASCLVDSVAFEAAAAVARRTRAADDYATALAHYTGEVLPEDRYADWAFVAAERLRALATTLRHELAALREASGDDRAAEALWQRVLADEPADEAAHVGLMRLYARQGQRQHAARQYHTLHGRLHDDLALVPDPATQRLYAAILGGQFPTSPAPAAPVPVAPAALPPHALPPVLTSLIGRTEELTAVGALLGGEARLLTLTGTGGCGKTRLALAVAEAVLPTYPDGVWWVGLAPLADGALVAETAARVLGVRPQPGQAVLAALTAALRDRTLLLILDNAEHLRPACADLALALLGTCPGVRVLATSRAALRVVGEQTWRVPSLSVPAPVPEAVNRADLVALAENDAVRLFVERARLARADFALTSGNAAAVVAICRRVEGLPLALELAAARVGVLAPGQLAARLDNALGLVTGGPHGLPDRQRTLRATLDWSHALLTDAEQRLLAHLALFAGGWTLSAAEAVCDRPAAGVLVELAGLVEHSLVQVEATAEDDEPRYRLLELVRQYAGERLAAGGRHSRLREAHAAYFLALAEEAEPHLSGPAQARWQRRLERDLGNIRAALRWWAESGAAERGLRLATALARFWMQQSYIREGWGWLSTMLPRLEPAAAPLVEAKSCFVLARLAEVLGYWEEGTAYGERSQQLYGEQHQPQDQAQALNSLALNLRFRGQLTDAQRYLEQSVLLFQQTGDRLGYAKGLLNLGVIAFDRGEMPDTEAYVTTALPELRAAGDLRAVAIGAVNVATYMLTARKVTGVHALLAESVQLAVAIGEQRIVLHALANLADLATLEGRWERAARLVGASQGLHRRTNLPILHSEQPFHDRAEATARAALGDAAFAVAYAAGQALTLEEAVAAALTLERVAAGSHYGIPSS